MKSRITLLTFAALLLTGSLVGATTAPSTSTPTAPAPTALAPTASAEAPSCARNASTANLAIFAPDPRLKTTDADYCGSCGTDPCRGVLRGTVCGYDFNLGRQKRCEMRLGDTCPQDNRVVCYCYAEDIP
jgi:hypothetical protein